MLYSLKYPVIWFSSTYLIQNNRAFEGSFFHWWYQINKLIYNHSIGWCENRIFLYFLYYNGLDCVKNKPERFCHDFIYFQIYTSFFYFSSSYLFEWFHKQYITWINVKKYLDLMCIQMLLNTVLLITISSIAAICCYSFYYYSTILWKAMLDC